MNVTRINTDRIFYFESAENTSETKIHAHFHDMPEIYYLTEGRCNYFIDNKSYQLRAGDIVFIPQGVIHNTNYISKTHSRLLINCSEKLIPTSVRGFMSNEIHVYKCGSAREDIDAIFKRIKQEYNISDGFSDEALNSCLAYLLVRIARLSEKSTDQESGAEKSCSEKAVEYVRENYTNKVTLTDAAKFCSVSSEHLSRCFKKQTGVGFNEYLCLFRLNKAEAMLINQPGVSVADIAYRCGFNDSNYFSNLFKKVYGMSPTEKKRRISK
ncbi:MAG: helix-turn-helix transcriptional regulator [Clostridia bacterium]|nr:helix-turn-helix transcriptional regulator [Clostridia bacterium]